MGHLRRCWSAPKTPKMPKPRLRGSGLASGASETPSQWGTQTEATAATVRGVSLCGPGRSCLAKAPNSQCMPKQKTQTALPVGCTLRQARRVIISRHRSSTLVVFCARDRALATAKQIYPTTDSQDPISTIGWSAACLF